MKASIPWAVVRGGSCELKLKGEEPAEIAERAHEVLEKLRGILETPKGFK
ncbi:MAG: hypothetical protein HY297_00205 [Thaumarchaeota archaeon]|nr:hypothetical protein [Nitrososphaerota archaeon]